MYLVEDTVEKAIYEISVERRMSHIGHAGAESKKKALKAGIDEDQIEAANTLELEQAPLSQMLTKGPGGGEMVGNGDLWRCLFRQQPQQGPQLPAEADAEVARHLRTVAAEQRQSQMENAVMEETS